MFAGVSRYTLCVACGRDRKALLNGTDLPGDLPSVGIDPKGRDDSGDLFLGQSIMSSQCDAFGICHFADGGKSDPAKLTRDRARSIRRDPSGPKRWRAGPFS
jgi:hypothetical protein